MKFNNVYTITHIFTILLDNIIILHIFLCQEIFLSYIVKLEIHLHLLYDK